MKSEVFSEPSSQGDLRGVGLGPGSWGGASAPEHLLINKGLTPRQQVPPGFQVRGRRKKLEPWG